MSITSRCNTYTGPRRSRGRLRLALYGVLVLPMLPGCGMSQGQALYFLGVGRGQKVEAKFRLTEGPIAILIDDPAGRIKWPQARGYLFDDLAQELLFHEAATKIVPPETMDQLRKTTENYEARGAREIGALAGAEQVLWIEVQDFLALPEIQDATMASYMAVNIKVINVLERERRSRVRLWPGSPEGKPVVVSMDGSEVSMAKTKDGISRELASRLAVKIAKYFYEYRLEAFEEEPS